MEINSFWKDRSVLVTGATGLVGSHLVQELLHLGADITAIVFELHKNSIFVQEDFTKSVNVINGDLANKNLVTQSVVECEPEFIIHLGAQTIVGKALKDPAGTFETNIQGTWNILESARLYAPNIKSIVIASSDKAYGSAEILPYTEDYPLHGDGPYDVSKSCTDLIAQSYGLTYKLPVTVARCGNIYGPGDSNWSRIVPGTFRSLYRNEMPVLRSDGTNLRDYIHVSDVVKAYKILAENHSNIYPGSAYNFSNDKAYSVNEIYAEICDVAVGRYVKPKYLNSAPSEIQDQHLSSQKAHEEFGWKALETLQSGLKASADWYQRTVTELDQQNVR
jgi:CDP-glucose 4,6-dehydratase